MPADFGTQCPLATGKSLALGGETVGISRSAGGTYTLALGRLAPGISPSLARLPLTLDLVLAAACDTFGIPLLCEGGTYFDQKSEDWLGMDDSLSGPL
jgi:hypothetical protein